MKVVCMVCERVFEEAKVFLCEGSGIVGEGRYAGFTLIPSHKPLAGKPASEVVDQKTGKVVEVNCKGSLRPPKHLVQ